MKLDVDSRSGINAFQYSESASGGAGTAVAAASATTDVSVLGASMTFSMTAIDAVENAMDGRYCYV